MRIVADENIVAVDGYFSQFGDLVKLPGREISAEDVCDADALLVRSITPVNRQLLENSRVRFVATATSGTDHLDLPWLASAGITVADAAGSNANAVVEYVLASVAELIRNRDFSLHGKIVAVIGAGHVGCRLLRLLNLIGAECVAYDPYVASDIKANQPLRLPQFKSVLQNTRFVSLDEALNADVISLHVPLVSVEPHRTFHLLNARRLALLKPGTLLINTSRGEVVDNSALLGEVESRRGTGNELLTIFDVWENEPVVSAMLARSVDIATPHIAGYSVQAKLAASASNYRDFLNFFDLKGAESLELGIAGEGRGLTLPPHTSLSDLSGLRDLQRKTVADALCNAFPVGLLSEQFKQSVGTGEGARLFDNMRKAIASRHEFGLSG